MPGSTSSYGLPYQTLTDAPDGASLGQDLAEAVETELVRIDADVARGDTQPTMQVFTASGTYNKPAGLKAVRVRVQGSGGGGGAAGTSGTGQASLGGGGGGGGYAEEIIPAASLGATVTVTVGAGGTAGAAGSGSPGGAGGTVSFGAFLSATGGGGGGYSTAAISGVASGGAGGAGTGGTININGQDGAVSRWASGEAHFPGVGGSCVLGAGAQTFPSIAASAGVAGSLYGGGGSGAVLVGVQTTLAGGAGAKGVVMVENIF